MRRIAEQFQASPNSRSAVARGHTEPIGRSPKPGPATTRSAGPSRRTRGEERRDRRAWTRILHLCVSRYEADVIDQLPGTHGEGQEVPALAEPHQPGIGWPVRNAIVRDDATVGDGPREDRMRRRRYLVAKRRVEPSAAMTTSPSATAPLANDTLATSSPCSQAAQGGRCARRPSAAQWQGFSTRSARCIPNAAFQPAESVTCTGAMGAPL